MRKLKYIGLTLLAFCVIGSFYNTYAHYNNKDKNKNNAIYKVSAEDPSMSVMDINNITSFIQQDGLQPSVLGGQSFNGQFPKGSNLGAIYQEGIVWGGQVNDGQNPVVRVGGATYSTGNKAVMRLFRVRPDYATADLSDDAANFFQEPLSSVTSTQIDELRAQYAKDWQQWPGDQGAPYYDKNGNGKYDPSTDVPGVYSIDPTTNEPSYASQTLFIAYDDSYSTSLYASPQIGMVVQETFWAYAVSNPLGNVIFKRVKLVYTGTPTSASNSEIDSLYIAQFADPDVGQYTDDYAGSDTARNLGFAYNSTPYDAKYSSQGLVVPAVGYDFLQGAAYFTGDPADSAVVNFKWRTGYKYFQSKPMSGFIYFTPTSSWQDPTLVSNNGGYDNGTLEMYNLLRGYMPTPVYPDAALFTRPDKYGGPEGGFGTYLLDGDPVTGQGWVDGDPDPAGDRRILCINGPISMKLNDTAEVVLALVGGEGTNNLSSVSVLKYNDSFAQYAYDQFFNIPVMPQPKVNATVLNGKVVLSWNTDTTSLASIEDVPHGAYTFEAYSVYQLPPGTNDLSKATRIATYDLKDNTQVLSDNVLDPVTGLTYNKPIVFLNNTGLQRYIVINEDAIKKTPLYNGQSYTFAVTAIAYNNNPALPSQILESSPAIVTVVPHTANPGIRYGSVPGDTLKVTHTAGSSDGIVTPIVTDNALVTGDSYKVTFATDPTNEPVATEWMLTNTTTGKVLYKGSNLSGESGGTFNSAEYYPTIDGVNVQVSGPPNQAKSYKLSGSYWVYPVNWGGAVFGGGIDIGANFIGSALSPADFFPVQLKFSGSATEDEATWSKAAVYKYSSGAYIYRGIGWIPITAWDISNPSNPRRVNISFRNNANDADSLKWTLTWDGTQWVDPDLGGRQYTFVDHSSYDPTVYSTGTMNGAKDDVMYGMWLSGRAGHTYLQNAFSLSIYPNYPILSTDSYSFVTQADKKFDAALAEGDINQINVFPNPYYGYNYREASREDHYVTFSHLPNNATIRIFDLAGVLVRTIDKNDQTQFAKWDLRNDSNYPVASGIYIAYIDMPDIGKTKIVKLAIIQEVQVLPVY